MTTLQEIEAALPQMSAEELARVEALIQSVRRGREEKIITSPTRAPVPNVANRPKRKMVPSSYNNGLWVLEAIPRVVVTEEMIRKIQDEEDETEVQRANSFYRGVEGDEVRVEQG